MAIEEIINAPSGVISDLVIAIGQIGLWLKAIGAIVILWLVVHTISVIFNTKRMKEVKNIKEDIVRIEEKIDKILSNTDKKSKKDD